MNAPACHDPANTLLPWYLNGTLGSDEEARVRTHVENCPVCSLELDQLSDLAHALSADNRLTPAPAARRRHVPSLIAASLLIPAIAGIVWVVLGSPAAHRPVAQSSQPAAESSVATLDLGAGPMRGPGAPPSLTLSPGVGRVKASLVLPVVPASTLVMELQDSRGRVLVREDALPSFDERLQCTYELPAGVFTASGEYAIVLRDNSPAARSYRYPFRVTVPAS